MSAGFSPFMQPLAPQGKGPALWIWRSIHRRVLFGGWHDPTGWEDLSSLDVFTHFFHFFI
jgi:hypothetical protein